MGIGVILQSLIEKNNTNVNELAKNTNVSPSTIYSMIRRDSLKANINDLYAIAHFLGVTLDYFYSGVDEQINKKNTSNEMSKTEESPYLEKLLDNFSQLNEEGQENLLQYSDFLVHSGKYKQNIKDNSFCMGKEA